MNKNITDIHNNYDGTFDVTLDDGTRIKVEDASQINQYPDIRHRAMEINSLLDFFLDIVWNIGDSSCGVCKQKKKTINYNVPGPKGQFNKVISCCAKCLLQSLAQHIDPSIKTDIVLYGENNDK